MNRGLVIEMSNDELKKITTEVKEVLAIGHIPHNNSTFSAIDLWNIQRKKKEIAIRKYLS